MIDVVPPNAAARVPVSKVSLLTVPPNGSSMCTCGSIAPGMTSLPAASMTFSAVTGKSRPIILIVSPSTKTSATQSSVAVTMRPFLIRVVGILFSWLGRLAQVFDCRIQLGRGAQATSRRLHLWRRRPALLSRERQSRVDRLHHLVHLRLACVEHQ